MPSHRLTSIRRPRTGRRLAAAVSLATLTAGTLVVAGAGAAGADPGPLTLACPTMATVAAGSAHTLAINANGNVFAWGNNSAGQLGDGTTTTRTTPVQVPGLAGVTAVAAGDYHSLAIGPGGTVYAWGNNSDGQLGDGTTTSRTSPVQVPGLAGATAVAAGSAHSFAIVNGTLYAWGHNGLGQLGDGTTTSRLSPVPITSLSGVTGIAAGSSHSVAVANTVLYAWGYNAFGQVGDNTTTSRSTPTWIPGTNAISAVSAGAYHSLAIGTGGVVWAFGYNAYGQLGDGTLTDRHQPVQLPTLSGVTAIDAGWTHTVAIGPGANAYAWGDNSTGAIGDGTTTTRTAPTQVPNLSGVTSVTGGSGYSLAVAAGGTVYAWGANGNGRLGDGTTTERHDARAQCATSLPLPGVGGTPGYPSDDCATGAALADGFAGGTYVRVRSKQADAQTTWVCVRADGPGINTGGKVVITSPVATIGGLPTTDANADACSAANGAPPRLAGHLGDPADPSTYVPYFVDTYVGAGATWTCVQVGTFRQRVIVPTSVGTTPPTVTFVPDLNGPHVPSPAAPATPSGSCQTGGGSRVADLTASGNRAYAYSWQPTSTVVKLCVRIDGAVTAGGVLTVDTTATGGAIPSVVTGSDLEGCDRSVGGVESPTHVEVRRSASTSPASVCVTVGTTTVRVTVNLGSGQPVPSVTWTPDPGTPGLP